MSKPDHSTPRPARTSGPTHEEITKYKNEGRRLLVGFKTGFHITERVACCISEISPSGRHLCLRLESGAGGEVWKKIDHIEILETLS